MTTSNSSFRKLQESKRIVVKIGSSSITGINEGKIDVLVDALANARNQGTEVVLVSSGAIATGMPLFDFESKPTDLETFQALAAVGQFRLIAKYQKSLQRFGIVAGQVLLTATDMEDEISRNNAAKAIERLIALGALPIVNENDTVATEEIRFGDNDKLAAQVAILIEADCLVLLSDVDGLYDKPPTSEGANLIPVVDYGSELSGVEISGTNTGVGTGGAVTKVAAAKACTKEGIAVLLTSADKVLETFSGNPSGTWFEPNPDKNHSKLG